MGKVEREVNTITPRQNVGRANATQSVPQMKQVEQKSQFALYGTAEPHQSLDKKSENREVSSTPKAKLA